MTIRLQAVIMVAGALFVNTLSFGQYKYGKSLADSVLFSSISTNNVLYVGIDNPLTLHISQVVLPDSYFLFSSNGPVFFDSIQFATIPNRSGIARIVVYKMVESDTVLVGYKFFKVFNIPDPMLAINSVVFSEEDTVSRLFLLNADTLSIHFTDDIIGSDNWFRIKKYSIGYLYGGLYRSYEINGNQFTLQVKRMINIIGPGKEIIIKPYVTGQGRLSKNMPIYRLLLY